MPTATLTSMFETVGLFYGFSLPVIILFVFMLFTLPVVVRPSLRAEAVSQAAYCYLAQMLGILLMTAGALPALYAVFSLQTLSEATYIGLLLVFAIGGLLFLWHDGHLRHIDAASKAIPGAIFFVTWKFIGLLICAFAGLSFVLKLLMLEEQPNHWWVPYLLMLLYGLIISWFTLHRAPAAHTTHVHHHVQPVVAKKPVAAKHKAKK